MVKTVFFYIKLYIRITSQYIKTRMEYRTDFFISVIGMIFFNITGFLFLWVIFNSVSAIQGWSYYELMFMYGFLLLALCPYQLFFENMHNLRMHIIRGTLIKYYFRPLNMMFYYFSEIFDLKGLGQLVLGIFVLVYASFHLTIQWSILRVLLLLFLICSSSIVMVSLMLIAAISSFWILNSFAIMEFVYKLKDFGRFPLTIFNGFFRFLFSYILPIGFISYYPVLYFLKDSSITPVLYFVPLLAGSLLFGIACIMWKIGTNNYDGTGS